MRPKNISLVTYKRLCIQGYGGYSQKELAELRFGIRLPYVLCATVTAIGLLFISIPILATLMIIAFLGVILPNHPLDYIYNFGLRQLLKRPQLPRRTAQVKFACGLATFWLGTTILLFWYGLALCGIIWGSLLVAISGLVSTTDICIPSMVYNWLVGQKMLGRNNK